MALMRFMSLTLRAHRHYFRFCRAAIHDTRALYVGATCRMNTAFSTSSIESSRPSQELARLRRHGSEHGANEFFFQLI